MDRFDNFDGGEFAPEEPACDRDATPREEDIFAAFLRCKQDACRAIELAAEEDSLEGAAWLALRQRLNQLAGTAGYFGEADLGLLARDLEHGLDILSPRGRTRRLRNAQAEFHRLAMRL